MASHAAGVGGNGSGTSSGNHAPANVGGVVSGVNHIPPAHDVNNPELTSLPVELGEPRPLPSGWHKFLDLQTGAIWYKKDITNGWEATVSRKGMNSNLDLNLNLSPPSSNSSVISWPVATRPSSSVSSELNTNETHQVSNNPEIPSMKLMGCPSCRSYIMSSEDAPKCPNCKNNVMLDFIHENTSK